jgi:hypothetical protein
LLIDAMLLDVPIEQKSLIKGDTRSVSIAAASILAKVERDRLMDNWHEAYPVYGLRQNKGYGTPKHLEALRVHGPTPQHRFSFAPVREASCWAVGATQQPLALDGPRDAEAADEEAWDEAFEKSQDKLAILAEEALAEFKQGKTTPLNGN